MEDPQDSVDSVDDRSVDTKRLELIRLSEEGELSQSVKYIKKSSDKIIDKILAEYEYRQLDKTSTQLADTLIVKFSELMCGLNVVASDGNLTNELRNDKLLQKNVKSAVSFLAPFIPFIGLISGGTTLGKHMMLHKRATHVQCESTDTIDE